jgi:hypothetical protein
LPLKKVAYSRRIILKTKQLLVILWLLFLAITVGCGGGTSGDTGGTTGGTISLTWDSNTDPDLGGYRVYYGTASGSYSHSTDVGNVTTFSLTGLTKGQTYFIVATAYDASQNESGYSNEVSGIPK